MRIILCDDDTVFTQVFEKRLLTVFKKYGITPEIVSAHTGVEALREITRRPTDVLFLDIDMPEKDGVGYLLNCRFVQICSRTSVTLTDGTALPVSRAKAEETQTAFMAYMRSLRP